MFGGFAEKPYLCIVNLSLTVAISHTKHCSIMTRQDYLALVNQAQRASFEYYVLSAPSMSDADFDILFNRITEMEKEHPDWIVPDSPTQCVGSDLSANGRRTILHRTPMLSCQKAQDTKTVQKWLDKTIKTVGNDKFSVTLEWKYDGISCSLVYQDGQLISASTRGDGSEGQDILAHASLITGIPQKLGGTLNSGRIEVRGEIVCPKNRLNELSTVYTDCRTAAASLCNQAEPSSDCSFLCFMPWAVDAPCYDHNVSTYEAISFAKWSLGFDIPVLPSVIDANWLVGVLDEIANMEKHRDTLTFPTDGIVIKVDNKSLSNSLGFTAHHPKGSIAYKFPPAMTITRCTRIEITTGKSGRRTPVAYFEPVTILGRTVSCATLYSESCAAKLGIQPGSTIEVGLSNDITPKVYRVIDAPNNQDLTETSTCVDVIDTPEASVPVDVPTVQEEVEDDSLWIAPSLFPEEELTQLASDQDSDQVVPLDEVVCDDGRDLEQTLTDSSSAPVTSFAAIAAATLSILAIVLLVPAAIAAIAFGFPLFNGSFKVS